MSAGISTPGVINTLDLLAPLFRLAVIRGIETARNDGLDVFVYETYRSQDLQSIYYARGRTVIPPTRPVTNASSNLYSFHGYGLAVDVISQSKGWNRPESWFASVAEHFEAAGCDWGGRWRMKDLPHFYWHKCKASPSDRARDLMSEGGVYAVWKEVGAL